MRERQLARPMHWLDQRVREQLQKWPQRPPGLPEAPEEDGTWLRGRPCHAAHGLQPFMRFPGASRLRTLPDGLWLRFSPEPQELWCDVLCIEACSSLTNFLDKRSRFAPSTSSLLVECPLSWLIASPADLPGQPRWRAIGCVPEPPQAPLVLPVRHLRVLFGLKQQHYQGFARNQVPQGHEYFCPMEALTAEDGHNNPALQALISRAAVTSNFMTMP